MELQPHEQRVVAEKQEVSDRLAKLLSFFQGPVFQKLGEAERSRLRNQARFMDGYAAVLEEKLGEAERSRLRNQARFMDGYAAVLEERIDAFGAEKNGRNGGRDEAA